MFYLKKEPNSFKEFAKYWSYIEELEKVHILPIAEVPLSLKNQ